MRVLKYSAAMIALGIFASPAFADCKGRLSQIENVIGPAASGTATPATQAADATKGTTAEGATGTQSGAKPSGGNATGTTAQSNGSIDMTSARTHLDAARTALAAGNESDCMRAADEAAKVAGLAQ